MISRLRLAAGVLLLLLQISCTAPGVCRQTPRRISPASQEVSISSACSWNETGIQVKRGHRYDLKPSGTWTDWIVLCDASGPRVPFLRCVMDPSRPRLRYPPGRDALAHFFSLVVCVHTQPQVPDQVPGDAFLVPREGIRAWTAPADGRLLAFANDWKSAYGNNRGALTLRVTEVAAPGPP